MTEYAKSTLRVQNVFANSFLNPPSQRFPKHQGNTSLGQEIVDFGKFTDVCQSSA
jgi:hypothetical protein